MPWWKERENRPALVAAIVAGALSVLASLLGKAYLQQRDLQKEATKAVQQAEAAAQAARQEANKGERAREQAGDLVEYIMKDLNDALIPIGQADVLESVAKQALSYFENLPPDLITPETESQQASVWESLANARYSLGDFEGSVKAHHKAITIFKKLLTIDPGDEKQRAYLRHALSELGIVLNESGQTDAARAAYLKVVEMTPSDDQAGRAGAEFGLAEVERLSGNPELALKRYAKASGLIQIALKEEPNNILWRQTLMTCHNNAGLVSLHLDKDLEAEKHYHTSLEAARKLVELEPDNRNWQKELATLLNNFGGLLEKRKEIDQAEPFFQEALALRRGLVLWDPKNTRWLLNLANSWHNDASLHYHRKNGPKTLASARKSLLVFQKLLTLEPENTIWLDEMMSTLKINRNRLLDLNQSEGALALSEETGTFIDQLRNGNKEGLAWSQALAGLHRQIGKIQSERGDEVDMATQHRLAAEAFAQEVGDDAEKTKALRLLAESYLDLGQAMEGSKDAALPFALAEFIVTKMITEESPALKRLQDFAARKGILATGQAPQTLVAAGATWKYWDHRESPGEGWTGLTFDDSAWKEGAAPLGYGNGDEATEIRFGSHARNKRITAWFRHRFSVENPKALKTLQINLRRDDGALVYLNGKEIIRDGLPDRKINPTTVADMSKGFDERVFHRFQVSAENLLEKNVIAVEVHQNEPQSSDLTLDLEIWNGDHLPELQKLLEISKLEKVIGPKAIPEAVRKALQ